MTETAQHDAWSAGRHYDHYMGRWSRPVASEFVRWLNAPENADWADIGCGTGALSGTILAKCNPKSVAGIDPSEGFIAHARETINDGRAVFQVGDAQSLPLADNAVDIAASALVLNFVPDRVKALKEMQRITRDGGRIAFYVWDYPGGGMGFIDAFWKAASTLYPGQGLHEAQRFPFCTRDGLEDLCESAGIGDVAVERIELETVFPDFEAFWHPFTLGAGPAPGYCVSLPQTDQVRLRAALMKTLGDGEIRLPARAWAVSAKNSR